MGYKTKQVKQVMALLFLYKCLHDEPGQETLENYFPALQPKVLIIGPYAELQHQ